MSGHFHNVQALRGVACLAVVLYHARMLEGEFVAGAPILGWLKWFGFAGVDLFFVLSGFIITTTNRRDLGRSAAIPGYLFRRFWRVYPTYWATMLGSLLLLLVLAGRNFHVPNLADGWPWWLALVPTTIPNALVGQAWTMSYEVMFYLAFGVAMVLPARAAAAAFAAWGAVVIVALAWPEPQSVFAAQAVSPFVLEFLAGCAIAWLAGRGVPRGWRLALGLGVAAAAAGVTLAARTIDIPFDDAMAGPRLRVLVFGAPAALIVYGFVSAEGVWPRRVPAWLSRLGDASYSLYLIHPTALLFVGKWSGVFVPHTRLPHTLWVVGTVLGVVAVGVLFHRWVERPLLALGKRRPKPPAAALAPLRRAA